MGEERDPGHRVGWRERLEWWAAWACAAMLSAHALAHALLHLAGAQCP